MKIIIQGDFEITEVNEARSISDYDELGWSRKINEKGAISHIKIDELVTEFQNGTKTQRRAVKKFKYLFLFKH
ncbi:MAG: hypothetical protein L3J83_03680, partial [Proteobacteria bacterium]|nr:hypothetical protein [Pseudomonadota bacterium]